MTTMEVETPYNFDKAYARCFAVPEVAMDKRHIYMLHDVLCGYPFKSALEIGSFNGASSTAFVEAINRGSGMRATFCDVLPTHSLVSVVNNCRHLDRVQTVTVPSWDVLGSEKEYDFILVDGNHDLVSVARELEHLIRRRPLCVMAHDTNATDAGYVKCEGARLLKDTFSRMPDYLVIEDCAKRPGERTERGLFLATREPAVYEIAKAAFAAWA